MNKRVFDLMFGSLLFLLAAPFMLIIALLVWLTSPGPVIFCQKRSGLGGRPFTIYKFRSIYVDYEQDTRPVVENDHRVTPLGSFLRRTCLDELPQLINVIGGEMSLVGPRPLPPKQYQEINHLIPGFEERLKVKPGWTGRAQIVERHEWVLENVKKKFAHDLDYIHSQSLWQDLCILLSSIKVLRGRHSF